MFSKALKLVKAARGRLGRWFAPLSHRRTAATLQSIAALATVVAAWIASSQFLNGERLIKERQSGLVLAAADRCEMASTIMHQVATLEDGSGSFRASLSGIQAGNDFALEAIPITEMSSARAVDDLLLCQALAQWYAQTAVDLGDRVSMCANAEVLAEAAVRLRMESVRPGSARVEVSENQGNRIERCSALIAPEPAPAPASPNDPPR